MADNNVNRSTTQMYQDHNAPPVNPLPRVLILLAVALFAAEPFLMLQKLGFLGGIVGIDGRINLVSDFWLNSGLLRAMIADQDYSLQYVLRFVIYVFVDGSFTGTVFTLVFTLALGNFVARAFAPWKFLVLFFASAFVGGVLYNLLAMVFGYNGILVGGMPGAFGLIGALTWMMWTGVFRHPIGASSPFALIGFLVAFRVVLAPVFGWDWTTVAEWGGFLTGFGLCFILVPGGWAHFLQILRRR
ncbi:MAG: rhomboid family intramembrane serine protease [Halocynthiibacter sp.]